MRTDPLSSDPTVPRPKPASPAPATSALKRPVHIEDFLLYRIHNLARVATQGVGLMFRREIGISRRDWRILAFVGRYPDLSLTRLAALAALDTVVASRCVAQLVRKGLIANTRLPSNKRLTVLTLTDAGRLTYERARAGGQQYNIEFLACLSDAEADLLDALLTRLEQRAGELTRREIGRSGGEPPGDEV
jgi:DNA-binding MarR family transcriptional regulator